MIELNLKEVKETATKFKDYNTYVFIQTQTNFYNGYITQVLEDAFMFMDDEIPQPFPVYFKELKAPIVPSKKKGKDFNFGRRE